MADNWTRVVNTTIANYIRQEEVNILRNRKLLAMLQSRGRISFNHSGTEMDWKVRYKRAPMTGYADGDTLSFARKERHKTAKLPWRGYSATDSVTKMERLQNRGVEAIIKVFSDTTTMLMDDIKDSFCEELFVDGNATGNSKKIHGFESFMGSSGAAAAGYVATPSDTYADLNTGLGYYGGAWSTNGSSQVTWPIGVGDAHYDFWSPLLVDYGNTAFAASTDNWLNNCIEATRFGLTHSRRNRATRGQTDLVLFDFELYRLFLQANEAKQQIHIRRGDKPGGLVALGFSDTINFDGVDVTAEHGVPVGVGYGVPVDAIELCSMQDVLFKPEGPDMEISTKSDRFAIDFLGNMKCNPRPFFKLLDLP